MEFNYIDENELCILYNCIAAGYMFTVVLLKNSDQIPEKATDLAGL